MGGISVRCKKCRYLLFLHPEFTLLNAHGVSCSKTSIQNSNCKTIQQDNVWFLHESNLPIWIANSVNEGDWTKGKISCPNCHGRLGSFDFISGNKCQCLKNCLPPIHLVKCKVDYKNETE